MGTLGYRHLTQCSPEATLADTGIVEGGPDEPHGLNQPWSDSLL
jgi:hypothetical protein